MKVLVKNKAVILYSFRRCPYAMRARMALSYANIDYEHREILLRDKPQSMLEFSAKGTVPVLIVDNTVIDESFEVMKWALYQSDNDGWLKSTNQMQLIEMCDNEFKSQLDHYKYADRFEQSEEQYREKSEWFLGLLNNKLSKNDFLFSNKISLADIAVFPFIRQYAFVNNVWFDNSQYDYLKKWLTHHLNSSLFLDIMKKHPIWQDK